MSSAMKDVLSSLSSGQQYLNIPSLPGLSSVTKSFASAEAVNVSIDECDQDVNEEEESVDEVTEVDKDLTLEVMRANCDRLNDRRATDFSQVCRITIIRAKMYILDLKQETCIKSVHYSKG